MKTANPATLARMAELLDNARGIAADGDYDLYLALGRALQTAKRARGYPTAAGSVLDDLVRIPEFLAPSPVLALWGYAVLGYATRHDGYAARLIAELVQHMQVEEAVR